MILTGLYISDCQIQCFFAQIMNQDCTNEPEDKPQSFCKNHPNQPSLYFLAEHPSIRYCRNCALNVALCGRKIEKELTEEERKRKDFVGEVSNELQSFMEVAKMNQYVYAKLEEYSQQVSLPLQKRLKQIERVIQELSELRGQLKDLFEDGIISQMKKYQQMIEKAKNDELQLMKTIQNIESNVSNIIELGSEEEFRKEQLNLKTMVHKYKETVLTTIDFEEIKSEIHQKYNQFVTIYSSTACMYVKQFETVIDENEDKQNPRVMTQVDVNLASSRLVQQLKINLTANAQYKCKKNHNETVAKKTGRKQSTQVR